MPEAVGGSSAPSVVFVGREDVSVMSVLSSITLVVLCSFNTLS